jgi:hypothetical protein
LKRATGSDAGNETGHDEEAAMKFFDSAATLTGERMMTKYTGTRQRPPREEIARLAYHIYQMRGQCDGRDVDDWLSAERALVRHTSR